LLSEGERNVVKRKRSVPLSNFLGVPSSKHSEPSRTSINGLGHFSEVLPLKLDEDFYL